VQSQLSADAACFIPSRQWHTVSSAETYAETSAAVSSGGADAQQHMNSAQSLSSSQQAGPR